MFSSLSCLVWLEQRSPYQPSAQTPWVRTVLRATKRGGSVGADTRHCHVVFRFKSLTFHLRWLCHLQPLTQYIVEPCHNHAVVLYWCFSVFRSGSGLYQYRSGDPSACDLRAGSFRRIQPQRETLHRCGLAAQGHRTGEQQDPWTSRTFCDPTYNLWLVMMTVTTVTFSVTTWTML